MHTCVMTVAFLRGGLSACSVVWLLVSYFFLKFIKILMQLGKNFVYKLLKRRLTPCFLKADWTPKPLFLSAAHLRLSTTISFLQKMTISNVFSSAFSDLTS